MSNNLNKQNQHSYCLLCSNHTRTMKYGITCSLSGKAPNFKESCPEYAENNELKRNFLAENSGKIQILSHLLEKSKCEISFQGTRAIFFVFSLVPLFFLGITILGFKSDLFDENLLLNENLSLVGGIMFFVSIIFLLIIGTYSRATVNMNSEKISFEKIIGGKSEFPFYHLKSIEPFYLGKTKYIRCKLQDENYKEETFLLLTSRSFLFRSVNAEAILTCLKDYELLKRFLKPSSESIVN